MGKKNKNENTLYYQQMYVAAILDRLLHHSKVINIKGTAIGSGDRPLQNKLSKNMVNRKLAKINQLRNMKTDAIHSLRLPRG